MNARAWQVQVCCAHHAVRSSASTTFRVVPSSLPRNMPLALCTRTAGLGLLQRPRLCPSTLVRPSRCPVRPVAAAKAAAAAAAAATKGASGAAAAGGPILSAQAFGASLLGACGYHVALFGAVSCSVGSQPRLGTHLVSRMGGPSHCCVIAWPMQSAARTTQVASTS